MSLNLFSNLKSSKVFHPYLNTSTYFDILNGKYLIGKDDNAYLLGGLAPNNAVVGGNNTQKTGDAIFQAVNLLFRHPSAIVVYIDFESSLDLDRLSKSVDKKFGVEGYFYDEIYDKRFKYLSGDDGVDGAYLHTLVKDIYTEFKENEKKKEGYLDLPFFHEGKIVRIPPPIFIITDSLSEMRFNTASVKFQEGDVDSGGAKRTRDAEFGNLKRVVFEDVSHLGGQAGVYVMWIGQTGNIMNLDGKPQEKESTFLRPGKKIDKCPKAIMRLPHFGIEIIKGSVLKNSDGTIQYPNPDGKGNDELDDNARSNPDMMSYKWSVFRNKQGASGVGGEMIGTQSDGIQEGLSIYETLKNFNYYGLDLTNGNKISHACDLMPDFKVGRTTVWNETRNNMKFFRAIGICYHLLMMQVRWLRLEPKYRILPKDLYRIIKEKGYDWNVILDSVDYFHTNPDIKVPTITAFQLLRVALGESDVLDGHPIYGRLSKKKK